MIFLDKAGKQSWTADSDTQIDEKELMQEYLEPNGLIAKKIVIQSEKSLALVEIDQEKLRLQDFYNWEEALTMSSKPECWRCFYFFADTNGEEWWTPKYCMDAEINGLGSIYLLFLDILRHFTKSTYDDLSREKQ
jgi:hypothetical protein